MRLRNRLLVSGVVMLALGLAAGIVYSIHHYMKVTVRNAYVSMRPAIFLSHHRAMSCFVLLTSMRFCTTQTGTTWPSFLVAFASNGCGGFVAYDLRSEPHHIVYIDPIGLVEDNLVASDKLEYESLEDSSG